MTFSDYLTPTQCHRLLGVYGCSGSTRQITRVKRTALYNLNWLKCVVNYTQGEKKLHYRENDNVFQCIDKESLHAALGLFIS